MARIQKQKAMKKTKYIKSTFNLPESLVNAIPKKNRSRFVERAIINALIKRAAKILNS